jgi:hypothetical protein
VVCLKKEYELAIMVALLIFPFAVFFASQSLIASHHFIPFPGIDFYCDYGTPEDCLIARGCV